MKQNPFGREFFINIIYYTEVNLICIVILLLLMRQLSSSSGRYSTANRVFNFLLWTTVLLCMSDMAAGILRGQVFRGAKALIELSNLIFYEALAVISYLWMIYVSIKLQLIKKFDKKIVLWSIPLILFSIVAVSNPFTHVLFAIDDRNLFVRNAGTCLHWMVTWLYLIVATAKISAALLREKSKNRRQEILPFLFFIIAPSVTGIIQMLFYGVTSSQVGVTISILIIFLVEQSSQVLSDSLTGLNNRHSFNEYLGNHIQRHANAELTLLMMDVNNFKQVNDGFGHIVGDHALNDVAEILKKISGESQKRLFICRYGGDEFLAAAFDCPQKEMKRVKEQISQALEERNQEGKTPYRLKISMGLASGKCSDFNDAERLLRAADKAMYDEKQLSKKADALTAPNE